MVRRPRRGGHGMAGVVSRPRCGGHGMAGVVSRPRRGGHSVGSTWPIVTRAVGKGCLASPSRSFCLHTERSVWHCRVGRFACTWKGMFGTCKRLGIERGRTSHEWTDRCVDVWI
eukprot:139106-Chlamydomonas_euryale.AAC.2